MPHNPSMLHNHPMLPTGHNIGNHRKGYNPRDILKVNMKQVALAFILCMMLCVFYIPSAAGDAEGDIVITVDTTWTQDIDASAVEVTNGSTLTIVGCILNVTSFTVQPGSSLVMESVQAIMQYGKLDGSGATLDVRNSTLNIKNETMLFANSTITIHNSILNGGVYAYHSEITIVDTTIGGAYIGVGASHGSTLSLERAKISGSSFGVYIVSSNLNISNSTIEDNSNGVYAVSGSMVDVFDSEVKSNGDGIAVKTGRLLIERSSISSSSPGCGPAGCGSGMETGIGLDLLNSNATLRTVQFNNNNIGLKAVESDVVLDGCLLDGNNWYGILSEDSTIESTGSTFTNNYEAVLSRMRRIPWAADPALRQDNMFSGNNYSYVQEWKLNIRAVDNHGRPVVKATVVAETVSSMGKGQMTRSTDANGEVELLLTTSHLFDNGTGETYNHTLNVSKTATDATARTTYIVTEKIVLQDNLARNIVLPIDYPDVEIRSISVRTKSNGTELEIVAEIHNRGVAAALEFVVKAVVEDSGGQTIIGMVMVNLTANQTREIVFDWGSPDRGTYTIIIEADPDNILYEVERDNNIATRTYVVGEDGKLPLAQLLGGVVLMAGVFLLYRTVKKQKPDVGMKM